MPSPTIPIRRTRPGPDTLAVKGNLRRRANQNAGSSSVGRNLNKLDSNEEVKDLMNDWELAGHQNAWVCPSDRHLQLRAQLKSGWSVRTATARSPTTNKQQNASTISDAEAEAIRKVLARAEQSKQNEQDRIGKMVDRLEKMKLRATGNGVTQCLICQTEFGLLSSKSYAAMCIDCRKYVCQKNCGVETFDQKRNEPIFLCKICSEYREVMWKKSNAWFYKEMPSYTKSPELPYTRNANGGYLTGSSRPSTSSITNVPSSVMPFQVANSAVSNSMQITHRLNSIDISSGDSTHNTGRQRQLPIPPDQQQRLKTVPRAPRITPSWVHEKVQSSMSIGSEDDESSSSSVDTNEFKQSVSSMPPGVTAPIPSSRRHTRTRELKHGNSSGSFGSTLPTNSAHTSVRNSLQRYTLKSRVTDTEESENDESRRTTPSTSPRHSLATPSSVGDDLSQNHITLTTHETSDAKSIDSGVVQSDNSIHQNRQTGHATSTVASTCSPPPRSAIQIAQNLRSMGNAAAAQLGSNLGQHIPSSQQSTPRPSPSLTQSTNLSQERESSLTILNAPPIPPRVGNLASGTNFNDETDRRQSTASTSTNNSQVRSSPRFPSNTTSHESLDTSHTTAVTSSPRLSSIDQNLTPRQQLTSRDSLSITPLETEQVAESPTFMSSPDSDDSKPLKEVMVRRRKASPVSRFTAAISLLKSSRQTKSFPTSSSASQLTDDHDENPPFSLEDRLPMKEDFRNVRTASPRRPTSASSLLATINESASSRIQSDEEECEIQTEKVALNGRLSASSNNTRRRSGSSIESNRSSLESPAPLVSCFCLHRHFRGGTLGSIQFNLLYLSEEKQLIIHLIRAKNLKAADKNGFSDPYVKFHLIPGNAKATKLTSKTIEKTLNPEWNEEMIYYGIMEEERQKKTLRVTVLDRDRIGSDFLGETRVALKKLPLNQTKKFNLYLEHVMPAPSEKSEEVERGKILIAVCYNIQQGSLFVHIKRCAELLGMDTTGLSDPYCKVSLTPTTSKLHRQRTAIKKRILNPEFNENLQFIVPFKDLPRKTLEIKVYDHDVGRHDDFIGGILLSTAAKGERGIQWTNVIENPGKTFEMWHKLEAD